MISFHNEIRNSWHKPSVFLAWWLDNDLLEGQEQQEFKNYYFSYLKKFHHHMKYWYDYQMDWVERYLCQFNAPKILDIGCGCGTESLWLGLAGVKVLGIDISDMKINTANARLSVLHKLGVFPNSSFEKCGLLDLAETDKYDIIWMEQAFHHLEPRELIVEKIVRLLNPGGLVVFIESNAWNPLIQLFLLKFRGFNTVVDSNGQKYGNERILTLNALCRLMGEAGLRFVDSNYFRLLPNLGFGQQAVDIECILPKWMIPLFTHYSAVFKK